MNAVLLLNPGWLGPIIGLISLSLAITFFLLGRRARLKGPTWAATSNNLVRGFSSSLPELEILFRKEKVDTVTVTRMAFWNRGMATIDRNDIAHADPLRIACGDGIRLLDVKVIQINSEPSRFGAILSDDGKASLLTFDFLDHDQGAVIQVIHTGTGNNDLSILGTIKGAGAPTKRKTRGAYLPLPTTPGFDRSLKPTTRRIIIRACETVLIFTVVTFAIGLVLWWLFPFQWTQLRDGWANFRTVHSIIGRTIELSAMTVAYFVFFLVFPHTVRLFNSTLLPPGLMSVADDPLEK